MLIDLSFMDEEGPTPEEMDELSEGLTVVEVDRMIDEKGVWYFLKLLNKKSFMQLYYAMTDKDTRMPK